MSASGRLTSVAATIAGMAHGARVYYVVADKYASNKQEETVHGLSVCQTGKVDYLVSVPIQLPSALLLDLLIELEKSQKEMETDDFFDFLRSSGAKGFQKNYRGLTRSDKSAYLMRLRGLLSKLEAAGYVRMELKGRRKVANITESGSFMAHLSGRHPKFGTLRNA